jgi:hypothetical protein
MVAGDEKPFGRRHHVVHAAIGPDQKSPSLAFDVIGQHAR